MHPSRHCRRVCRCRRRRQAVRLIATADCIVAAATKNPVQDPVVT
ncbi:hypothetical protein [Agrobacterium sp. LMR679]